MIASILAAFLLGMRHGADPDHLAAIDNITRASAHDQPLSSKLVGTLFAGGHTVMVFAIAMLIATLGSRFGKFGSNLELAGTWLSVAILFIVAGLNLRRLALAGSTPAGIKTRLFAAAFRGGKSAFLAVPIGLLFGLGFETSSQIAAYVVIVSGGLSGALLVGGAFCLGMMLTDTCDSVLVSRLVREGNPYRAARTWLWAMTLAAIGVALYEAARLAGLRIAFPEIGVSTVLVVAVLTVYAYLLARPGYTLVQHKTK